MNERPGARVPPRNADAKARVVPDSSCLGLRQVVTSCGLRSEDGSGVGADRDGRWKWAEETTIQVNRAGGGA